MITQEDVQQEKLPVAAAGWGAVAGDGRVSILAGTEVDRDGDVIDPPWTSRPVLSHSGCEVNPEDTAIKVSLPQLTKALGAQRWAVMQEMERRHNALLLELRLGSTPDSHAARPPLEKNAQRISGNNLCSQEITIANPGQVHGERASKILAQEREVQKLNDPKIVTEEIATEEDKHVDFLLPASATDLDCGMGTSSQHTVFSKASNGSPPQDSSLRASAASFSSHTAISKARQSYFANIEDCFEPMSSTESALATMKRGKTEFILAKGGSPFQMCVLSPITEVIFCTLILCNVVTIAADLQYSGIENGYILELPGFQSGAEATWPHFMLVNTLLEIAFGILFTIEVCLKLAALQHLFFRSGWNFFDLFIVATWLLSLVVDMSAIVNPTILRLVRLGKLMRLVRLIKWLKMLDSLHVLVTSTVASISVLLWSSVLLVTVMTTVSLLLGTLLRTHIEDESRPLAERTALYTYFGSATRSFFSVFEITLGNYVPVFRLLLESINEWYALGVICYKLVVEFSFIKVITGVFMHETFKVAQTDDHLMVLQTNRAKKMDASKMLQLFTKADEENEGSLSWEQFEKVVADPFIKSWLTAMELSLHDLPALFALMDGGGDGKLSAEELVAGVDRLKGGARGVDMVTVLFDIKTALVEIEEMKLALLSSTATCESLSRERLSTVRKIETAPDFGFASDGEELLSSLQSSASEIREILTWRAGAAPVGNASLDKVEPALAHGSSESVILETPSPEKRLSAMSSPWGSPSSAEPRAYVPQTMV